MAPSSSGGGHQNIRNNADWVVGCLGVKPPCAESCDAELKQCMDSSGEASYAAYAECVAEGGGLSTGCSTCAPTLAMLSRSQVTLHLKLALALILFDACADPHHYLAPAQVPSTHKGGFGASAGKSPRPETSICKMATSSGGGGGGAGGENSNEGGGGGGE